ncbi:unnamed protein product, partial [Ixodes pacificus]
PDYAEVDTHNLTTFYKNDVPSDPEPYATTTLINSSLQKSLNGSAKDGRSGNSGEEGSRLSDKDFGIELKRSNEEGITNRLLESEKLTSPISGSGSHTANENGMPIKKSRQKLFRANDHPKGPMMNWAEIIPPPPEQPPSDAGSAPNTPASHRGGSSYSRQLKEKLLSGCSQASPNSARVVHGASRFIAASPRASLDRFNHSLGTCYADPTTGPLFTTRDLRPLLRPPQHPQKQTQPSPFCQPLMDRGVQSSLPSLVSESHSFSPALELSGPHLATLQGNIYHPLNGESDAENISRPRSLESSVAGDTDYAP